MFCLWLSTRAGGLVRHHRFIYKVKMYSDQNCRRIISPVCGGAAQRVFLRQSSGMPSRGGHQNGDGASAKRRGTPGGGGNSVRRGSCGGGAASCAASAAATSASAATGAASGRTPSAAHAARTSGASRRAASASAHAASVAPRNLIVSRDFGKTRKDFEYIESL